MRTIRTYILRLMIDSDYPGALCGALQAANVAQEPQPFRDEAALLALLKRLVVEQETGKRPSFEDRRNGREG